MKNAFVLLILLLITTSCSSKVYPLKESDFKLSYELSNPHPKLGDTINVRATLQNATKHTLDFEGDGHLIYINVIKPGDPDSFVRADVGSNYSLKSMEERTQILPIILDKSGKYKVYIAVYDLTTPINGPTKPLTVNLEPIYIDVQ